MASKLAHVLVVMVGFLVYVDSMSNCGVSTQCDQCPPGYWGTLTLQTGTKIKVCCRGCRSKYFTFESSPKPACTCHFDRLINEDTCSKGEQCCGCRYEKPITVNTMPICCSRCAEGRINYNSTQCACVLK